MKECYQYNQSWSQLAVVQAGGAFCLPVLMIGQSLAQSHGLVSALLAILVGNLILFFIGLIAAISSAKQRKSTAEFAVEIFGEYGKVLFAGAMAIALIGWFAIQLKLMGMALQDHSTQLFDSFAPKLIQSIIIQASLGSIIMLVGSRGISAITKMANALLPLLCGTIVFALLKSGGHAPLADEVRPITFEGISIVLASAIAIVIDLPTFFREARSSKDAAFAVVILFCLALPIVEFAGIWLYIKEGGNNILDVFRNVSANPLWQVWITGFILFAGWAMNNCNMYSSGISMEQIFPHISQKGRMAIACTIGTALSCFNILEHLEFFLNLLGIFLSSMGALMVIHLLCRNPTSPYLQYFSCGWGIVFGFISLTEIFSLTKIPVIDTFLMAFASGATIVIIKKIKLKQEIFHEIDLT